MEKGQIWNAEGLPVNGDTIKTVVKHFKESGIKNKISKQNLAVFLNKISDDMLLEMYDMDADATLEMFVECFGVRIAFDSINCAAGFMFENRQQQIEELKAECENWAKNCEDAQEEVRKLKEILAHYKADLYDFYAQAGKMPRYETE